MGFCLYLGRGRVIEGEGLLVNKIGRLLWLRMAQNATREQEGLCVVTGEAGVSGP